MILKSKQTTDLETNETKIEEIILTEDKITEIKANKNRKQTISNSSRKAKSILIICHNKTNI